MFALADWIAPLNTAMIVLSGMALIVGRVMIARKNVAAHKRAMLTASGLAVAFLITYVIRWALFGSTPYTGNARAAFLTILVIHVVLSIAVIPLALQALRYARRGEFAGHKRWARWAFPMWLVVAVTGWVVYGMLHR